MNNLFSIILFILILFSPVLYQIFLLIKENKENSKLIIKKIKKYTIYTIIGTIPIIAFILTLNTINFLDYKSPMPFREYDKITLNDFKGLEFFKKSVYGNKRFAYIVTSIETNINDNEIEVQAFFHPSRSFVYKTHIKDKDLLRHELYHFKITELYARRIKKRIKSLKHIEKNKIKEIIENEKISEKMFQKKYDFDTFHSYVYHEQKKYEHKIDSLLSLYSEYKNPKIKINESY